MINPRAYGLTEAAALLRQLAADELETANRLGPDKHNVQRRARAGGFNRAAGILERRVERLHRPPGKSEEVMP